MIALTIDAIEYFELQIVHCSTYIQLSTEKLSKKAILAVKSCIYCDKKCI